MKQKSQIIRLLLFIPVKELEIQQRTSTQVNEIVKEELWELILVCSLGSCQDCNDQQFIFHPQHCQQTSRVTGEVSCSPHPSQYQTYASEQGDTRELSHLLSCPMNGETLALQSTGNFHPFACLMPAALSKEELPTDREVTETLQLSAMLFHL